MLTRTTAIFESSWIEPLAVCGVSICLLHAATLCTLRLAIFGPGHGELERAHSHGDADAAAILELRRDGGLVLATILWGSAVLHVTLTFLLLLLCPVPAAFALSVAAITLFGEMLPRVCVAEHGWHLGARLAPVLHVYRRLFSIVATPTSRLLGVVSEAAAGDPLDARTAACERPRAGRTARHPHAEHALRAWLATAGEPVVSRDAIVLPCLDDQPIVPAVAAKNSGDPFVRRVAALGRRFVILEDERNEPRLVLDADAYLRAFLFGEGPVDGYPHCCVPIVVRLDEHGAGDLVPALQRAIGSADPMAHRECIVLLRAAAGDRVVTGSVLLAGMARQGLLGAGEDAFARAGEEAPTHS